MEKPLISVIITILNGDSTFSQCLESIQKQNFTNYEVVVVDGGSTEDSIDIFKGSLISQKILSVQPGIGLYAGLNAGTDLASGTWYYFMGCDDEFYRYDTLTIMAEVAQNCSEKILTGKVKYTNGYIMTPALGSPHFMKFVLHHQGTFYHKDIFDKYRYSEELTIASDYELNVKLGLAKVPFRFLSTIVALYGDNGISSTQYKANFAEVSIVNRRLFTGLPRAWVICFCKVKHSVWLIRNKLGLLNIKSRMKGALRLHKQYSL